MGAGIGSSRLHIWRRAEVLDVNLTCSLLKLSGLRVAPMQAHLRHGRGGIGVRETTLTGVVTSSELRATMVTHGRGSISQPWARLCSTLWTWSIALPRHYRIYIHRAFLVDGRWHVQALLSKRWYK